MGMFDDDFFSKVGEPFSGGNGFTYGTHEVIIGEAKLVSKNTQKMSDAPVIEIVVFDETDENKKATCTLYFHTEGGAKMSVAKILGLLVHNSAEDKKDAIREIGKKLFGSIDSAEKSRAVALKLINDKLIGKKAYLVATPSGKYPTTSYGDIWHYPAAPQVTAAKPDMSQAGDVAVDDLPNMDDVDV